MQRFLAAALVAVLGLSATVLSCQTIPPSEPRVPDAQTNEPIQEGPADKSDEAALVQGNTAFAVDLYGKLKDRSGNLFFSPYSLSDALGMTFAGARGQTAEELAKVLHFTLGDRTHAAFAGVNRRLQAEAGAAGQLAVANALWGQQGYSFRPDFLWLAKEQYQGGFGEVNFRGNTEAARKTINQWVDQKTNHKITELLDRRSINTQTRLVLTNAVYFKADWAEPFKKSGTSDQPFQVTAQNKIQTPMMHRVFKTKYGEADNLQMVSIPYSKQRWSFVLMLPRETEGLANLEKTVTADWLKAHVENLWPRDVDLTLARFRINDEFRLKDQLAALGAKLVFSDNADLTGISDEKPPLKVDEVIHKSFVEVEEKGTEAAAATAIIAAPTLGLSVHNPPPPVVVRADHPFMFLIRDNATGTILFLGRVVDPRPR